MQHHEREELAALAETAMRERGLLPAFDAATLAQVEALTEDLPAAEAEDLTALPWCSIDDDDSRDLDQLTAVLPGDAPGSQRLCVAIADVDARVPMGSPADAHARANTTSVYTAARIFPMLPERLSTDLTSLNAGAERLALVTTITLDASAAVQAVAIGRARVVNHARLAYDEVADWLDGTGPLPAAAAIAPGMAAQLRAQDALAARLLARRVAAGALEFQSYAPRARFVNGQVVAIRERRDNRARRLIAECMVAVNGATAQWLAAHGLPALRRVVRAPERWARIAEVAAARGHALPAEPDGAALAAFLAAERARAPETFADLSLVLLKLMGPGEYVVEAPGGEARGHFGLGVREYAHATAPNRRYPDLITQRQIKAALAGAPPPYDAAGLADLAAHCTRQEDAAGRVERQLRKSEAALLLRSALGQVFTGRIMGLSKGNVWVRLDAPPAEGRLRVTANHGLAVGDRVQARLDAADVARGHIDFTWVADAAGGVKPMPR